MQLFRCNRCLYPNTKPDLYFVDGTCSACLAFDARKSIDWKAKEQQFIELVRSNPGKTHDVIVACSGGKDSTWQVVKCLELGLKPLAVTATTDHLSELGRKNLDNISRFCDHVEVTPNKSIRNKIARFALEEVGDISWCEHHAIWSIPAREAVSRAIPIVLYGEAPQNEYGAGPKGSELTDRLTDDWVHEFGGLLGLRLDDISDILDVPPRELEIYRRPEGVEAVFMGAYFDWDGFQNYWVACDNGFRSHSGKIEGSYGIYENLDNLQTGIHDRLRWLKFGYSRAGDIVSSHIRRGRIKRRHGALAVQEAEQNWPNTYLGVLYADILAPLGLTEADYDRIAERFTNKPVVEWASKLGSFQSFYGETQDASEASPSVTTRAA
jgi:N-acetyl sugar amidotransferase